MTVEQKLKVFRTLLRDQAKIQATNADLPLGWHSEPLQPYHHQAKGKQLAYEDVLETLENLLPEVPSE